MSSWDLHLLAGKAFGLFFVATGLLQLLDPYTVPLTEGGDGPRAGGLKLRYGEGGKDLRHVQKLPRWPAFMMIGLGGLYLFLPGFGGSMDRVLLIVMGSFLIVCALLGELLGGWFEARRQRRYEAELARVAAAADDYSDELRALHANPPLAFSRRRQLLGTAILTLFGGIFLALGLAMPR